MKLRLIVIRTPDIQKLAHFYTIFGLNFEYHQHGNSPFHYSAKIENTILEIYPLLKSQEKPDNSLRLGFEVDDFEKVLSELKDYNLKIISNPIQTEFGVLLVIEDLDGRKIELYKK